MSQLNSVGNSINRNLLAQAQARMAKTAWTPPGSTPSMPAVVSPEAGRSPAQAGLDLFSQGGQQAIDSVGKMLPKPTIPYAAGGMGGMASTGAGVVAANPKSFPKSRPAPAPKPAAPQQPAELHPSDQAKAILAQLNQRRRDAAFGRGSLSAGEDRAMAQQADKLFSQSNKMRNAPGYKPNPSSAHPRDQADVVRQRLNSMRSSAGGEVAQAPRMLRQLSQLGAASDAAPVPTRQMREPQPVAPAQRTMLAKASSLNQVKSALMASFVGGGLGAMTSPEGHRMEGAARGAVKGTGTGLGALAGMPLGVLAAAMMLKGRRLPFMHKGMTNAARSAARKVTQNDVNGHNLANALMSVGIGAPVGGVVGGAGGYAATSAALGKPSWQKSSAPSQPSSAMGKESFLAGATLGAGLGALTSEPGHRAEGIGRGAVIGGGTHMGAMGGAGLGALGGAGLGALLGRLAGNTRAGAGLGAGLGAGVGALGGGYMGHVGAKALLGPQKKKTAPKKDKEDKEEEAKEAAAIKKAALALQGRLGQ